VLLQQQTRFVLVCNLGIRSDQIRSDQIVTSS